MALSLHAEYLLGYLAGARGLAPRDVVPFTRIDPGDASAQTRALVKSLALGVSDGRKGHTIRDASEVRVRVLAMLSREPGARPATGSSPPGGDVTAALGDQRPSDPELQIAAILEQAVETG